MKKTKLFLAFLIILLIYGIGNSQETANKKHDYVGHVTLIKKTAITVGGGTTTPNSNTKNLGFGNLMNFNLGLDVPIKNVFGLHAFGEYNFGNGNLNSFEALPISGFTSTLSSTKPKFSGFAVGAGPQLNFGFGENFMISPMVDLAFVNQKLESYSINQNYDFGGATKNFSLYNQSEIKTSGLGIIPRLRFQYFFTKNIGIWLEGNYAMLPDIKTTNSTFVPNGTIGQGNEYNIDQILTGTTKTEELTVKNSGIGFGGGIVINISGRKGWNGKIEESTVNNTITTEEEKLPANIQKLIDEQNTKMNVTFQKVKSSNMKANSLCNFSVEKVEIECNGKDAQGNKKYKVKIVYKNLSTSGVGSLGHYLTACNSTISNGNYIEAIPSGSATITGLSPGTSPKTLVPPLTSQVITFDFVPGSGFISLNIKGNVINSATSCGNCDDIISLNLPNCCDGCELNPVSAFNNSSVSLDDNNGTINIKNTISSPNNIVKIEADLVNVKIIPNNNDCLKCNDKIKKQDHFVDKNQIINNTGWANTGNPTKYEGENSDATVSRSLTYTTTSPTGINLSSGAQFNHTIGVSPTSCCGDTVEIWIRYTVWDKDCHVCDKLVKSVITRKPTCNSNSGTSGTGQSTGSAINMGTLKN